MMLIDLYMISSSSNKLIIHSDNHQLPHMLMRTASTANCCGRCHDWDYHYHDDGYCSDEDHEENYAYDWESYHEHDDGFSTKGRGSCVTNEVC